MIASIRNRRSLGATLLLALFLLVVQTATAMHELDHDLLSHDDASCALHLFSQHGNDADHAGAPLPSFQAIIAIVPLDVGTPATRPPFRAHPPRAPPLFSV